MSNKDLLHMDLPAPISLDAHCVHDAKIQACTMCGEFNIDVENDNFVFFNYKGRMCSFCHDKQLCFSTRFLNEISPENQKMNMAHSLRDILSGLDSVKEVCVERMKYLSSEKHYKFTEIMNRVSEIEEYIKDE